jgi:ribosome biogenesis GTPase
VREENQMVFVVVEREKRRSLLSRPDVYKKQKEVVANVDQMLITMAVYPELIPHFLDKYLVAATLQGIRPIILLNKADLLTEQSMGKSISLLQRYRDLGYVALLVSQSQDLAELESYLRGKLSIFVGPSGVGKSALINAILRKNQAAVGEMSVANQKGCHTTTRSNLYPLEISDGEIVSGIIDSPGIREFGLWNISPAQAALGFIEFEPYLGRCKFRNCTHENTPGCALEVGRKEKKISPERWESFLRLLAETARSR